MQINMNSQEQGFLKEYFESYGKSKYPKDSDFIDFTTVSTGPNIYGFGMTEDMTCPITGAVQIAEELPTFMKLDQMDYCYSYNQFQGYSDPHNIGIERGSQQAKMVNNMITTLKENTVALKDAPPAYVEPSKGGDDRMNKTGALSGIQDISLYGAAMGALVYLNLMH